MTNNLNAIAPALAYLPGAAFLLDSDLNYFAVTSRFAELMNRPVAFFTGTSFYEIPVPGNLYWHTVFDNLFDQQEQVITNILFKSPSQDISIICYAKPVLEFDQSVSGILFSFESDMGQISSKKEVDDSLILSEAKYRTIFENVQDVFYQANEDGLITEISPSIKHYSGYSRDEVLGRPVTDFYYHENDRSLIVELLKVEGSVIDFEVRLKTRSEELRYASVNARLIKTASGQFITEGSMRDVTARKFQENALKALNAELQASNEQKNKLLSIIGHDLRNPISGSLQLLELTLMDYESSSTAEIHAYLQKMQQELRNANALLEDLLTWAKTQFNAFNFNPVFTKDLSGLIRNCMDRILPMAQNKGVILQLELEDSVSIVADVGMLETILRNLVTNAIKFTRKGDTIEVCTFRIDNAVQFSVKDSGIGIPAETLEQLFKKNVNYTTYGTSGEKGTGLGLSICYDFVARHGGELWAESIVGEGSTFHFLIPQPQQSLT